MATQPVDSHASRSRSLLSAGVSLLVLVALLPSPVGAVKDLAFADIDPAKPDQVSPKHLQLPPRRNGSRGVPPGASKCGFRAEARVHGRLC